jgi:arginyl-tRNA--protein-N-Asp/Glu arginylyltransferase
VVLLSRWVFRYVEHRRDDRAVRQRIKQIADARVRYGFPRIQILLLKPVKMAHVGLVYIRHGVQDTLLSRSRRRSLQVLQRPNRGD